MLTIFQIHFAKFFFIWLIVNTYLVSAENLETYKNHKAYQKFLGLSEEIIYEIADFLSVFDQINFSNSCKVFNAFLGDKYWEFKIKQNNFLFWDKAIPVKKIFLANLFYKLGYQLDPAHPENDFYLRGNIPEATNYYFAKRARQLGFPKAKQRYDDMLHKKRMESLNIPIATFDLIESTGKTYEYYTLSCDDSIALNDYNDQSDFSGDTCCIIC